MPKLAKSFRQINLPDGTKRFFFDEDEFPWFTQRDGVEIVQVDESVSDLHYVTMRVMVSGPITTE
jgi:hypothetical protein